MREGTLKPSRAEVLAVARLARLTFSSDELDRIAFELRGILAHVEDLKHVVGAGPGTSEPTEGGAVSSAAGVERPAAAAPTSLRPDVPGADALSLPPSGIATEWRDGFFTVPRLRTHDTSAG